MPESNKDTLPTLPVLNAFLESVKTGMREKHASATLGDNIRALCTIQKVNFDNFCENYGLTSDDLTTPIGSRFSLGVTFKARKVADALDVNAHKLMHEKIEVPAEKIVPEKSPRTSNVDFTHSGKLIIHPAC